MLELQEKLIEIMYMVSSATISLNGKHKQDLPERGTSRFRNWKNIDALPTDPGTCMARNKVTLPESS